MSTFKNLQDDTLDLCQELQGRTDFTLTRIKRLINQGYYDFVRKTRILKDYDDITTVANQTSYDLSDQDIEVLSVKYVSDSGSLLLKPYPGGWSNIPTATTYGTPEFYWYKNINTRSGGKIGTEPTINTSDNTLRIWVSKMFDSELSANDDVPELKLEYHDALVYYATWRLYAIYGHLNEAWSSKTLTFKNLYDGIIKDYLGLEKPMYDIRDFDSRRKFEVG